MKSVVIVGAFVAGCIGRVDSKSEGDKGKQLVQRTVMRDRAINIVMVQQRRRIKILRGFDAGGAEEAAGQSSGESAGDTAAL